MGGGNQPSNLRRIASETNLRKGGHEGRLVREWQRYRQQGLTDAQIEELLGPEIESMVSSPPERPMDPVILDSLPGE